MRISRKLAAVVLALLWCAVTPAAAQAAPGPADLDRSFGGDGMVAIERPSGEPFNTALETRMAIGPEDEIFVLYSTFRACIQVGCPSPRCPGGCDIDWSVARYDSKGNLDRGFGVGAGSALAVHASVFGRGDIAVGPDGKPVIAVYDDEEEEVTVGRFDRQGHLDGSFGTNGRATSAVEGAYYTGAFVAVQADGKVVVGVEGADDIPGPEGEAKLILARYLPTGSPDPSFGIQGRAELALGSPPGSQARPAGIVVGARGTVSVGVSQCCGGFATALGVTLARVLDNGGFDPSFLDGGRRFFATPTESYVQSLTAAPDGKLYAVFKEGTGAVAIKMLPDGSFDPAFGAGGQLPLALRLEGIDADHIVADSGGRLHGVDSSNGGGVFAFRLRSNGSKDRTFNGGTHLTIDLGGGEEAIGVGLQSNGRMVILAESGAWNAPPNFTLIGLVGKSRARCLGKRATIVGTREDDELTGTRNRDVIAALGGRDKVHGMAGADLICGGKGRDGLFSGPGHDEVKP